jgi:hypothetical protein
MVKLVSKILRNVGGRTVKPGEEFEVDDRVGAVLVESGHAEAVKAAAAAQAAPAPKEAPAPEVAKPAAAAPKASTEVKPMSTADGPNQGEYATRDLKAKG